MITPIVPPEDAGSEPMAALLDAWTVDTPDISAPVLAALDSEDRAELLAEVRALRAEMRVLREEVAALRRTFQAPTATQPRLTPATLPITTRTENDPWNYVRS